MSQLSRIPELAAINSRDSLIRIPAEQDVPVTPRIRRLIDSPPFQRLASISQLGLVAFVYPGATHSRFEHSLGTYRMALLFLQRLATNERFANMVNSDQAVAMLVAALLHDIGHWPYCHPFEDMGLDTIPHHEKLAKSRLSESNMSRLIQEDFGIPVSMIVDLLEGTSQDPAQQILHSVLSGPIDVDKMDYLYRDSLHAGVPYGLNYDRSRLIGSLCLNQSGDALAINEKGRTAAELLVFARYVMFSEVYWHHTVRAGTAMLQRSMFELLESIEISEWFDLDDRQFQQRLLQTSSGTNVESLVEGIFVQRRLFKRLAQFTVLENEPVFQQLSRRPYEWLVRCSTELAAMVSQRCGVRVDATEILIDAPPAGLEVQFQIDIANGQGIYRPLDMVSPVVQTLAREQFDNYVKRVRVFIHPRLADLRSRLEEPIMTGMLQQAIQNTA